VEDQSTVHFLRDMLGHGSRTQQPLVSGAVRGIFTATSAAEARQRLGQGQHRTQGVWRCRQVLAAQARVITIFPRR
jgi:transposase-like protein